MLGMPGNYIFVTSLNESLSQKKGNSPHRQLCAPPSTSLNESPRPKVEKSDGWYAVDSCAGWASMKVPTQRWRNKTIKPIKVAALMPQ